MYIYYVLFIYIYIYIEREREMRMGIGRYRGDDGSERDAEVRTGQCAELPRGNEYK